MLDKITYIDDIKNMIKEMDSYKQKTIDFTNNKYIIIEFHKGYRDAEESWKIFNIEKEKFNTIIESNHLEDVSE